MKSLTRNLFSFAIASLTLVAACTTEKKSDGDGDDSACTQACDKIYGCGQAVFVEGSPVSESECSSGCESEGWTSVAQCINGVSGCNEGAMEACFGGGGGCDTGSWGSYDSALCDSCFSCAYNGACAGFAATCENSADCGNWINCVNGCSDDACWNSCDSQYPTGLSQYLDVLSCIVCGECPNNCDAASMCE